PRQRVRQERRGTRKEPEPARARRAAGRDSRGQRGVGVFRELQGGHGGKNFARVIKELHDWLDRRINHRQLTHDALYEAIPGGARWRYAWGSTLVFAISVQFITGLALWFGYSA